MDKIKKIIKKISDWRVLPLTLIFYFILGGYFIPVIGYIIHNQTLVMLGWGVVAILAPPYLPMLPISITLAILIVNKLKNKPWGLVFV